MKPIQIANEVVSSGKGDSYEEDGFLDGEESTSKEFKRQPFEVDSFTDERYTPQISKKKESNSIVDDISTPQGTSEGQANRSSVINTVIN